MFDMNVGLPNHLDPEVLNASNWMRSEPQVRHDIVRST